MRAAIPALAAVLLTPVLLSAQVRSPDARAVPAGPRDSGAACELSTGDGLILAFAACPAQRGGNAAREVEVIEYRNGDAQVRSARVTVQGAARGDLTALHIGWGDPDDDGDGLPTADVARRPGRTKVGRVTLRRTTGEGEKRTALPWDGDVDGDGFPVTVELQDASGGSTTVSFERCSAVSGTDPASDDVTLVCREARMVAALDANPYARYIAGAAGRPEVDMPLMDRRTPPSAERAAPAARGAAQSTRAFRLEGVRVEGWSLDLDAAHGTGRWTLEVRVNRVEMA
jgi:hypothetical protein